MVTRPKQFYFIAILLMGAALSFPVQVIYLYEQSWLEVGSIVNKISLLNWVVVAQLVACSYLHFKASKWLKFAAPLTIFFVALNNYVVGSFSTDYSMAQATLATGGLSLLFAPLLMKSSRMIMADPKRRWWARPKRYYKRVSTTLNPYVGGMIHTQTFDVSETGAFVCLGKGESDENLPKVGERIRICLNIDSMKKIRCEAVIVRRAEPNGRYPKGMGVRFIDFEKVHQKSFMSLLKSSQNFVL